VNTKGKVSIVRRLTDLAKARHIGRGWKEAEAIMISEDADLINAINKLVDDFDQMGFGREEIGAALTGIGLGLVRVHAGDAEAMRIVGSLESLLVSGQQGLQ
jgi:hypothetical protein